MNAYKTFINSFLGRVGSVCAVCALMGAGALGQDATGDADQPVQVTAYDTVTLAVQDADLAEVLEMLSIQSEKNIISSKNVSATISANLFDVTFYEALDAILKVNGFDYIEEGNFIYVYTLEEIQAIEDLERRTEPRTFTLEHLSAADANDFIAPLLSENGRSSFRGDVQPGFKPDVSDGGAQSYAFEAKLVVNDYPENLEAIAALLDELDSPPQQVLVEATILQTTLDEANAWGVDFNYINSVDFTDLTDPLSVVNNLLAGSDEASGHQPDDNTARGIQQTVGNTNGPAGLKIGIISDDISLFIKVLDEVTDSKILARPKVMCLNRQRAEVLVGTRVGYLSTTATETTTTQTVEFLDTGIQLIFRPFISRDGSIRMELKPSVSEASLRTVTDAAGLQVTIPDEFTNELTTNVRMKDSETLVLGGLFRESISKTRRQVPFLGDIPILGAAFKGQDDSIRRTEIIFLITPSVVHDARLWAMGESANGITDEVVLGARRGLLPFSQERQTDNYNVRARDAFNRGDVEQALFYVNNSLRLNPGQPEVIKLRQQIVGVKDQPHERAILERLMESELGGLGLLDGGSDAAFRFGSGFPAQSTAPTGDNTKGFFAEPISLDLTEEEKGIVVDGFIHDYFRSLGLANLSPYREMFANETEENWFEFTRSEETADDGYATATDEDVAPE